LTEPVPIGPAGNAASLSYALARHKDVFFHTGWSRYSGARPGWFRLVPSGTLLDALRADYARMQPMFFGPAPSFDELVDALRQLEARINAAE
jgi:hypothetical protein